MRDGGFDYARRCCSSPETAGFERACARRKLKAMITRVEIKNYRSIAHADVKMGPLTVLVGRNGSGKSSFVDALKFVRDALQTNLENAVKQRGGFNSIRRFGAPENENIEITIEVRNGSFVEGYQLALRDEGHGIEVRRERSWNQAFATFRDEPPADRAISESQWIREGKDWVGEPPKKVALWLEPRSITSEPKLEIDTLAFPALGLFGMFSEMRELLYGDFPTLIPDRLRAPQTMENTNRLNDNGDNLLSALQHLIQNKDTKAEIVNALGRVTDGISDLRVSGLGSYLIGELQHGDLDGSPWFELKQESDGTLRMLGLLTALHQATDPFDNATLLALEEPEDALHPGALAILADELKSASRRRQLLITTQSPDLIARVAAEELRVVERRAGVTHIAPLEDEQREVIEAQLFDAGELLRSEGLRGAGGV